METKQDWRLTLKAVAMSQRLKQNLVYLGQQVWMMKTNLMRMKVRVQILTLITTITTIIPSPSRLLWRNLHPGCEKPSAWQLKSRKLSKRERKRHHRRTLVTPRRPSTAMKRPEKPLPQRDSLALHLSWP